MSRRLRSRRAPAPLMFLAALALALTVSARAQTFSDADWVSLNPGMPGANGVVSAMTVDGNGNVYVGGTFTFVGTVPANGIAKWNGSAWSALGLGLSNNGNTTEVSALAVIGTNLYVGGVFSMAGGVTVSNIAKWDGRAWSALGSGIGGYVIYNPPWSTNYGPGAVNALAVIGTNLYVGGGFSTAGGMSAKNIAKWDGSAWSTLGLGLDIPYPYNAVVRALAVGGTNLYAGGYFWTAGGVGVGNVAKWDGSTWSAMGGLGGYYGGVFALAASGTNLYASEDFAVGNQWAYDIVSWNGAAWSALGSGMNNTVSALTAVGTNLFAGGYFTSASNSIAEWDGSAWSALDTGMIGRVSVLAGNGSNLFAAAPPSTAGGAGSIAKWDGSAWSVLGSGMNGEVLALAVSGTNLFAGGQSTTAGAVTANYIAQWDGRAWSALGSGMGGSYPNAAYVYALAVSGPNLYAGGYFTTAGGLPVNHIAKWNGSVWSALGSGIGGAPPAGSQSSYVEALAVGGTALYAGGHFTTAGGVSANYIAQWDGNAWSALGSGMNGNYADVCALAVLGTNLYAGGDFSTAGGVSANCVAKWNGSVWSPLGSGIGGFVYALAVSGTNLYAGGYFTNAGGVPANYIAKWDGSVWSALGSGIGGCAPNGSGPAVSALAVSGTDLYAGGPFTTAGGLPANCIAKWDGSVWSPLGLGMNGVVNALSADRAAHLFVGGAFTLAGTNASPYLAEAILQPSLPTILLPPRTQTAEAGARVHLVLDAKGEPPPAYQWCLDGTNIPGCGADGCLDFDNISFSQSGTFTVVVANYLGAVTSAPVMLNVIAPVARRLVPGVNLTGKAGNFLGLDYRDNLGPATYWQTMATMTLSNASQFYFDLSPLPPHRFYRAWQTGTPAVVPSLDLHMVPALTVTGNIGDSRRLDCINQFGPTDAWVTLATVKLTNTSQLYFDTSSIGQPARLWRIVPLP